MLSDEVEGFLQRLAWVRVASDIHAGQQDDDAGISLEVERRLLDLLHLGG